MNDIQHVEAARAFAERILREGGFSAGERIDYAVRITLARPPKPEEAKLLADALTKFVQRYQDQPAAAEELIRVGQAKPSTTAQPTELAAYTLLSNLILNLDEAVTRN